jgi:hypothetical protein
MCLLALARHPAGAAPVTVRFPEASLHGFLALRSSQGELLASGELNQLLRDNQVHARLTFHFKDGSLYDETVVFSQQRVFALLTYHLIQHGPSFPHTVDVSFNRKTGRYTTRFRKRPADAEDVGEGRLDLPTDVYNGMTSVLLKNLAPGETGTGHMLAFTPKPRLLKAELIPAAEDSFTSADTPTRATRYLVKLELGGLVGVIAPVVGKEPPRLYYWIARTQVPAFVKYEGPQYMNGPVWRIELTAPRWPK